MHASLLEVIRTMQGLAWPDANKVPLKIDEFSSITAFPLGQTTLPDTESIQQK